MPTRYAYSKPLIICIFLLAVAGVSKPATAQQATVQVNPQKPAVATAERKKTAYSSDKTVVAKGQLLFQNTCSPCHNFLQKGIGPSLGQVTDEMPPAWLKQFIRNAPGKISQKDPRAIRLLAEYKQVMPAFTHLNEADINALLAYIHANQKAAPPANKGENGEVSITNPITAHPTKSGLRLRLSEVLTAPATATAVPRARINTMTVLPASVGTSSAKPVLADRVHPDQVHPDRVFLQDLRGILYELVGNELRPFMDIRKERPGFIHAPGLGTGFGSVAFHPEFYKNGLFYTTHNEKAGAAPADFAFTDSVHVTLQGVLMEWKMSNPSATVFAGTGRELMRINFVAAIHGLQEIIFNPLAKPGSPDYGLLYIGIGDGGSTEEGHYQICSDSTRIWGSVVRIAPSGSNSRNGRYGIPPANPYAEDQNPATLGEIFCRGFRNPNRITWAPDGKMIIADIGQYNAEEINLGRAGADYGWPEREGTFRVNPRGDMSVVYALPPDDSIHRYSYPVAQYDHDEGNAISGGFVYTGTALPLLRGKYVFGDIVSGRVFFVDSNDLKQGTQTPIQELDLEVADKPTTFQALTGHKKADLRLGIGLQQELYFFTKSDGKLYRVTDCIH